MGVGGKASGGHRGAIPYNAQLMQKIIPSTCGEKSARDTKNSVVTQNHPKANVDKLPSFAIQSSQVLVLGDSSNIIRNIVLNVRTN